MISWLKDLFGVAPFPDAPEEPGESDHFYSLEQTVQEALGRANAELIKAPDNHHLEQARNLLSDAYICLWRASQWWEKYRDAG